MSDSPASTPPKPKPGSLRDRIAAFENKGASGPAQDRPPPPRPKPAGFASWKPRPRTPPDSPAPSTSSGSPSVAPSSNNTGGGDGVVKAGAGGMNAADAKESITRSGGSLKERMAALQGRGGFGAPSPPPVAPKPATENRPKWKPPPQVVAQPVVGEEDEDKDQPKEELDDKEESEIAMSSPPSIRSPPPIARSPPSTLDDGTAAETEEAQEPVEAPAEAGGEPDHTQVSEEEEERQRRAALAARMAKLGGARIGMGPPVFGRPMVPPPSKKPSLPPATSEVEAEPPVGVEAESTETAPDTSPRPPSSMPIPIIPKRAAPPRRKPAKQTSTGTVASTEASSILPPAEVPASASLAEENAAPSITPDDVIATLEPDTIDTPAVEGQSVQEEKVVQEVKAMPEEGEEEDEEEARKKRVAEKLAKIGGVNPFALPPGRKPSVGSTASAEGVAISPATSPPVPARKPSVGSPRPIPVDKPANLKRGSVGSVKSVDSPLTSGTDFTRRASVGSVASVSSPNEAQSASVGRSASMGSVSVKKVEEFEEVQEITEEPEDIISEDDNAPVPPVKESVEAGEEKDENDVQDIPEEIPRDKGSRPRPYDDEDISETDFDATPQPPPRVPQIASSILTHQGNQVDPNVVANPIPPSPGRSPPPAIAANPPLPPLTTSSHTSQDRSFDGDRLSGPAPPRRIVPQTPEPSTPEQGTDNLNDEKNVPEAEARDSEDEAGSELAQSTLFIPPPAPAGVAYRTVLGAETDEGEESEAPLRVPPPPSGVNTGSEKKSKKGTYDDIDTESNTSNAPLPVKFNVIPSRKPNPIETTKPSRTIPPPPPPLPSAPSASSDTLEDSGSDYGDENDEHEHEQAHTDDSEEPVLRTRPLSDEHSQISISSSAAELAENIPLIVPPRLSEGRGVRHAPIRSVPLPPGPPSIPPSVPQEEEEQEVLDEDEGDPIDPSFHSPSRRGSYVPGGELEQAIAEAQGLGQGSLQPSLSPSSASRLPPLAVAGELEENQIEEANTETDKGKAGRQTIAERMARLGGIKFGAGPGIIGRPPVPVPPPRHVSGAEEDAGVEGVERGNDQEKSVESTIGDTEEEEEEERARRERISAKLAGMGGMRIGMLPMAVPPRPSHALRNEPTPPAALPPPIPQPTTRPSGASESGASSDGVKVEAEESEMEEVGYEEAHGGSEEGSGEEVPPPPPPARPSDRRGTGMSTVSAASSAVPSSTLPTVSSTRPPVPIPAPFRRTSVQSTAPARKSQQPAQAQPSEYVLVDEPHVIGEETEDRVGTVADSGPPPPPPPARPLHRPPPVRAAPSTPPASLGDSISQWELPAIPTSSLAGDLSASWSEALLDEPQSQPPQSAPLAVVPPFFVPAPAPAPASRSPEALHLDADDLMAMWGRVGVQICEAVTRMYDQSKKNLVGDGTYRGLVDAVLNEVPNASKPQSKQIPYGYLVYLQNGSQVQKRASEIMPGDVVEVVDARFKGHKGLGSYSQHVGAGVEGGEGGGPVVGIVCEFEMKKRKIRSFQANQHVGQQTMEVASYRLDDLKSGLVKVYRVLET